MSDVQHKEEWITWRDVYQLHVDINEVTSVHHSMVEHRKHIHHLIGIPTTICHVYWYLAFTFKNRAKSSDGANGLGCEICKNMWHLYSKEYCSPTTCTVWLMKVWWKSSFMKQSTEFQLVLEDPKQATIRLTFTLKLKWGWGYPKRCKKFL